MLTQTKLRSAAWFFCGLGCGLIAAIKYGEYIMTRPIGTDEFFEDILTEQEQKTITDENNDNGDIVHIHYTPQDLYFLQKAKEQTVSIQESNNQKPYSGNNQYLKIKNEYGIENPNKVRVEQEELPDDHPLDDDEHYDDSEQYDDEQCGYEINENDNKDTTCSVITEDEYCELSDAWDKEYVQWFEPDDVYLDEHDRIIPDFDGYIGCSLHDIEFDKAGDAYIKSDSIRTVYTIHRYDVKYTTYMGEFLDDEDDNQKLRRPRVTKDD